MHPNSEGAHAYARCVNAKIEEIENEKAEVAKENGKLDFSSELEGYSWLVKPMIEADTIIGGEEDYYDEYSYIQLDGKYGIIDYKGNIIVKPEYDDYDDDMVTGWETVQLAVFNSADGNTAFSDGRVERGSYGNAYWCKHGSGYYLNSYDKTVYSWSAPSGGYIFEVGKDEAGGFLVQEINFVPEKDEYGTKDDVTGLDGIDGKWFLCDAQGNELTPRYKYFACPWRNGSGSQTTCAFSNDGVAWDNYTWDGTCVVSRNRVFESNSPGAYWKTDSNQMMQGFPFCATEGYIAQISEDGRRQYFDITTRHTFGDFEDVRPLHNGKAWVKYNGKWGVISVNLQDGNGVEQATEATEATKERPPESTKRAE